MSQKARASWMDPNLAGKSGTYFTVLNSASESGSPGALLRRGPLRTVRATRRGTRLKRAR